MIVYIGFLGSKARDTYGKPFTIVFVSESSDYRQPYWQKVDGLRSNYYLVTYLVAFFNLRDSSKDNEIW
jgi:hypothetical protein